MAIVVMLCLMKSDEHNRFARQKADACKSLSLHNVAYCDLCEVTVNT